jgi:hypothetical protein
VSVAGAERFGAALRFHVVDPLCKRLPVHELEHQSGRVAGSLDALDLSNVTVIERNEDFSLALEAIETRFVAG